MPSRLCYMRYEGPLVADGLLDARRAGEALLSFDSAVRHFVSRAEPRLSAYDYGIPVSVREGSWEAWIPDTIGELLTGLLATGALAFTTAAAVEIAKAQFSGVDVRTAFIRAFETLLSVVRLAQHVGTIARKKFDDLRWRDDNVLVGVVGEDGERLFVKREHLEAYISCNRDLLAGMVDLVEPGRVLILGVVRDKVPEEVAIDVSHRPAFVSESEESPILPELVHGELVELEGEVTRGNLVTNSVGFRYKGHILDCHPSVGSVREYREELYRRCRIHGIVSRADDNDEPLAKKPKLNFSRLVPLEQEAGQIPLF